MSDNCCSPQSDRKNIEINNSIERSNHDDYSQAEFEKL